MVAVIDLGPAVGEVKKVIAGIDESQLGAPTPCEGTSVAGMLDHFLGLSRAFIDAARKDVPPGGSQPPSPSADALEPGWREEVPRLLDELAQSWRDPAAWEGMTEAGGVTMPAEVMGTVALDELVVHGWDLARATGQSFAVDPRTAKAVLAFTSASAAPGEESSREGIFGPPVAVPDDASTLDRAIGFSGRDPQWAP